jgi:hypothetical protein
LIYIAIYGYKTSSAMYESLDKKNKTNIEDEYSGDVSPLT